MKILKEIRGVSLGSFVTRGERLAFWINTYNALVADGIAALGLRRSVWELPNFFQRVGCRVGGLTFTADARQGYRDAEAVFICVGTPSNEQGQAEAKHGNIKPVLRHGLVELFEVRNGKKINDKPDQPKSQNRVPFQISQDGGHNESKNRYPTQDIRVGDRSGNLRRPEGMWQLK